MTTRDLAAPRRSQAWLCRGGRALCLSTLLLTMAGTAPAQLISIRTVPVAQGDQFDIFPSHNLAMGGVSIALADSLRDPFVNPGTGARLHTDYFFGAPTLFSVSQDAGGGRTLPLAAFLRSGSWYGAFSLAGQEMDVSRRDVPVFPVGPPCANCLRLDSDVVGPEGGPSSRSRRNAYAFAMLGTAVPGTGLSVGGSVFLARLHAVDGVDLLYAGSDDVRQSGDAVDVRLGLVKEWDDSRSLEALVLHNRFGMTHDVVYVEQFWDPGTEQVRQRSRIDQNLDHTNTWGLHLEYKRPLGATGWRVGWLATANRMSHPKIPNYEIMNIPRDPGNSSAFNIGMGLARTSGSTTFGIDAIYEPIWSNTWAEADAPIETQGGEVIPAGGKTIENDFRFSNALVRMGVTQLLGLEGADPGVALQLGLVIRAIDYRLEQYDNVQAFGRTLDESWVEWTPTWGLALRFPELEIRYRGRVTNGTGRPGVAGNGARAGTLELASPSAGGILVAPSGPLTLEGVSVVSHQISLALPLR